MRAIVTGANPDAIGGAIARRLAAGGGSSGEPCQLVLTGTAQTAKYTAFRDELQRQGADVLLLSGDLTDPAVPAEFVARAVDFCGGLDAVVANAGVMRPGRLSKLELSDWDEVFAIDVRSVWLLAKAAHPALKESRGAMVTIASIAASSPYVVGGAYSAAKAAAVMLSQQLAMEWACDGVRVNTVSPGVTRTTLNPLLNDADYMASRNKVIPLGRLGDPGEIAAAVAFLLGPEASYITGEHMHVDGGLLRSSLDRIPIGRPYR